MSDPTRDYAPNIADARDSALADPAPPTAATVGPGAQIPVQDPSHDADAPPAPPAPANEREAFQAILNEVALILGTADAVLGAFQQGLQHPLAVIQRPVKQVIVMRNPPKAGLVGIILPGQSIATLKIAYEFLSAAAQDGGGSLVDVVAPADAEP